LAHQWNELCNALRMANKDELISFFEVLSIEGNQQNLTELEQSLVESLSQTFECNIGVARELFGRLLVGLKTWTTTERHIQQVFLEDVYSVLGFEEDIDDSQHRLAAPFLKVGRFFAKNLIRNFCRRCRQDLCANLFADSG